jgi:hypothetical protein
MALSMSREQAHSSEIWAGLFVQPVEEAIGVAEMIDSPSSVTDPGCVTQQELARQVGIEDWEEGRS